MKNPIAWFRSLFRRSKAATAGQDAPKTARMGYAGPSTSYTPISSPEMAAARARVDAQIAAAVARRRMVDRARANLTSAPTPARRLREVDTDSFSHDYARQADYSESSPVSTSTWDALSAAGSEVHALAPVHTPPAPCSDTSGDWSSGSSGSSCMDWGSPSPSSDPGVW